MIIVHHLNNSRSQRILWLLEELNLPYEIKHYQRLPNMLAPPELKAIHPLGKSPLITDGNEVIAESGNIIQYLVEKYGNGKLRGDWKKTQYWLHYAEGSLMPVLLVTLIVNKIETSPMPFFVKPIAKEICKNLRKLFVHPQLKLHLDYIEAELTHHEWFSGNEFSVSDIMMSFPLEAARTRGGFNDKPKIENFLKRIHERDAYKKALERGGKYDLAI